MIHSVFISELNHDGFAASYTPVALRDVLDPKLSIITIIYTQQHSHDENKTRQKEGEEKLALVFFGNLRHLTTFYDPKR